MTDEQLTRMEELINRKRRLSEMQATEYLQAKIYVDKATHCGRMATIIQADIDTFSSELTELTSLYHLATGQTVVNELFG